ncbi:hypothetical protein [Anaeromyxobacter diazotrophicus]|uniref:Lipoprotein n=1 Tax=Anaeromyxobacter diazotrophicus TaxID=2590199 RepID=A0A7I9VLX1_9BACT|nr:hypothetical protein [Anaeromyxobacter diazotrophicus]GEJ57406.1 hypothetical protein AMYX_21470 [Anaeromyxobacter diazotrophicus]
MQLRHALLAAPLAAALACGGANDNPTTGGSQAALTAAAPTYAALSLDQVSGDTTGTALATASPTALMTTTPVVEDGTCHPHLFMRQREVVERVNRHIYKVLRHVEAVLATGQVNQTNTSATWETVANGIDRKFTVTFVSGSVYTWELDVGAAGTSPLPVAMTGQIDRSGTTGPHQGKGTFHLDFAALHAGFPAEQVAQGTLDVQFDTEATARTLTVVAKDVKWELDPAWLDNSTTLMAALSAPRSGSYVFFRQPGTGGSLKLQDQMVFACPANPSLVAADAQLVTRWFKASDGSVHGRSDALMTGGQLALPVDRVVAVTCHLGAVEGQTEAEGLWLMKAEAADGTTVKSWSAAAGAQPCDPLFGAVPDLADAANDFKDWPASYSDGVPYPLHP